MQFEPSAANRKSKYDINNSFRVFREFRGRKTFKNMSMQSIHK